ncbi:MAG: carboxymuconolactone decarboxylase family protein [Deltaproteobacteria bacterium]|nr:carboxymuconolactone decarboxylase family protein [Candidatus Dadabacteria bacterium]TDJ03493.1 MAG: carboxymuconolactone decarboxylase family protein [Deltaproteobacteria bacterium]
MNSEKYQKGWDKLNEISPGAADRTVASLNDIAPDMVNYLMEFVFGEISSRPGLDMRAREITAVAALTALGTAPTQLKVHIKGALNCGCNREEVTEVIMQTLVYAGFPAALTGLRLAKECFEELDEKK